MDYRGRFAPSPTGPLHLGSLVAALAGWLRTRGRHGTWLVRIENLDPPRDVPGAAGAILAALDALGLAADEPVLYQSQRGAAYAEALRSLADRALAFPCWCSRGDLARAGALHRDGRCLHPPRTDRPPAWRLRVPDRVIGFRDALQGPQHQNVRDAVGDFVLRRADGLWNYQLACVVDDAFQGVTEVVRGVDLLDSTPRQILLQQFLGLPTPAYAHIPLVLDAAGEKLSKSTGAPAIDARTPSRTLAAALRVLGWDPPPGLAPEALLRIAVQQFTPGFWRSIERNPPQHKEQA